METTIYRNAAELRRAILDAAALAPADACAIGLPDWRPADPDEAPANIGRADWRGPFAEARDAVRTFVAMHGPTRPAAAQLPRAVFRFSTGPGAVSSVAVVRTAPRLADLAETVRKRWALFGGGPKPEEVKPKPARRAEWSPAIFKAWRLQLQDADHVGAMLTGERIGARYYPGGGERGCFALAAPVQVEGLPVGLCSFLRDDGRWVVADDASGLAVGDSAASRRAAESGALQRWADAPEEKRARALESARAKPADLAAGRAAWVKVYGIADPAAPADPAPETPAAEVAAPTPADPAPAAPAAAGPAPAEGPTPPISTDRGAPPISTNQGAAAIPWQVCDVQPTATYCTPVRRIGVHEWVTMVYVHQTYGACTEHAWRRVDSARFGAGGDYEGGRFFPARDWPAYDGNDTYSGLPRSLGKLYEEHRGAIEAALQSIRAGMLPSWAGDFHKGALKAAREAEEWRARTLAQLADDRRAREAAEKLARADRIEAPRPGRSPLSDATRAEVAEELRTEAAAPAWFDRARAAVYRAHVKTAALAAQLYPGPCGPCEDNPRQWLRARRAPEFQGAEVREMRASMAAALRLARAGHAPQLPPLDEAEARRLAGMRPPAELRERAASMAGAALRHMAAPARVGLQWAAEYVALAWARAAVYREAARLAAADLPPPPREPRRDSPAAPDPAACRRMLQAVLGPLGRAAADGVPTAAGLQREAARIEAAALAVPENLAALYAEVARQLRELAGPDPGPARRRGAPRAPLPGPRGAPSAPIGHAPIRTDRRAAPGPLRWPGGRPVTYAEAMAAGRDAGNRAARAAGRRSWAPADFDAAAEVTARMLGQGGPPEGGKPAGMLATGGPPRGRAGPEAGRGWAGPPGAAGPGRGRPPRGGAGPRGLQVLARGPARAPPAGAG